MLFQIPIEKHSDLSFTFFKKTPPKIYFLKIFKGSLFFALPQESEFWLVLRAAKLQFLKNIVWLILSKQCGSCNNLNVRSSLKLNGPWKVYRLSKSSRFSGICRSLKGLSKMVLINVLVFVVWKMLHNFVFVQKCSFANNCWCR